jgi:hypothetical protein
MTAKFVRTIRAWEGETVEIQWQLKAGGVHYERITIPPPAARLARSVELDLLSEERSATGDPPGPPMGDA